MTDKAIIEGCYVDLKFLPGLKSARVFVDIPIEYSNLFLKMFDAPDRASPVRVAIARLATPTAEPLAVAAQAAPIPDKAEFKDWSPSRQAGYMITQPDFQEWIHEQAVDAGQRLVMSMVANRKDMANKDLLYVLGLEQKRDLATYPLKAEKFKRLLTDFDNRQHIR